MRLLHLAAVLALSGCYASHQAGDHRDAGVPGDARAEVDAGPLDTGPPDAGADAGAAPDAGPIDCGRVAGYRRCDARCPLPCTATDGRCVDALGVCRLRDPGGRDDNCLLSAYAGNYTSSGLPCAILGGTGMIHDPWGGVAMPVEFCLAAPRAGLPDFPCIYSDGTRLVTGPPPGDCPPSDPDHPFCGGSCGTEVVCPYGRGSLPSSCVGVSDTRSHGVCMVDAGFGGFCNQANAGTFLHRRILEVCAEHTGQECACLVLQPQAFAESQMGFPMVRAACSAYRARFPETTCVNTDWAELP